MLCYVMLCYVMLCHVMLCNVMLCYVMLCNVMLCYVLLCYVMLCQVMLGYVRLCQVMLCQVRLGQVRLGKVKVGQFRLVLVSSASMSWWGEIGVLTLCWERWVLQVGSLSNPIGTVRRSQFNLVEALDPGEVVLKIHTNFNQFVIEKHNVIFTASFKWFRLSGAEWCRTA